MDLSTSASRFERAGRAVAYGLLGAVGTGAVALASLHPTQPIQGGIYDAVYLRIGPSEATEAAILTHFLAAGIVGIGVPTLIGDYLSDRLANGRALGAGIAAMTGLLGVFLVAALAGLAAFLTALGILAVGVVALRYRFGVHSGGLSAFAGGAPVVVLLLLLAGFGLGWGWGYVVTAQEVPAAAVNETPVDFEPAVERDLFDAENCETNAEGRRVCHLLLRGYERERVAARSLARHGVKCPYQNARSSARSGALVAEHGGSYFRVTCSPHGD
jgi:hypothetical protein